MEIIDEAKRVFDIEIEALKRTRNVLDHVYVEILDAITNCEGKVILTGMGKPGHIARKISATLASLGTSAFFLHPAEALHGDLGMVSPKDIVIAISYSGESEEIIRILPNIKLIGAEIIAITANANSTLAKNSNIVQILPPFAEACYLGLAPTSSTTAALVYGDSLAVVASHRYGFGKNDFAKYHPAGSLGKKLIIQVKDIMCSGEDNACLFENAKLTDAILEMSRKALSMVIILTKQGSLAGVITDGDLRRAMQRKVNIYQIPVTSIMTKTPIFVQDDKMAIDALRLMNERKITALPVVSCQDSRVVGTLTLQMLNQAALVL